ncbi:hypothetical protein HDU67_007255 [Dinochytrium kinnereticum]|nr:hypothetical protein HDU67_007255 [Dinochytrium kinnereticum]
MHASADPLTSFLNASTTSSNDDLSSVPQHPTASASSSAAVIPSNSSSNSKPLAPLGAGPKCIQVLETQPRRPITSICVNEGKLYAGGRDGTIVEWDATQGTVTRTFSHGHSKGITSICASGSRLFSSSEDGSVIVWNIATGSPTRTIRGHDGYVTAVCVSPEGRLYSGGADRMINEWDPVTGRRLWILTGHTRWVLALCAAGGRLYSGGNDHTVRVWDMANGRCLLVLEEHSDWVFSLCLGRDLLYSSSRDGTVRVWDTSSGQCLRTLRGHGDTGVRAVCIAAGRLYSAGDDKAIVEWDVKSGKPTKTLGGHFGAVACLCAGYDGKLYSGSGDCTVRVWEIVPPPTGSQPTPPMSPLPESANTKGAPERRHTTLANSSSNPRGSDVGYGSGPTTPTSNLLERRHTVNQNITNPPLPPAVPKSASRPISGLFDGFIGGLAGGGHSDSNQGNGEDVESIREQLAKAQELLAKQNKLKFRLKGELATARTELAASKTELAQAQEGLQRLAEVEEELAAAKELLVMYKTELTLAQDAHISALDYIMKQADSHFLEIELDLASVRHLLESPWTPLYNHDEGLEGYMPPKIVKRCWESDSDWDSDVEIAEDLRWWQGRNPFNSEASPGSLSLEEEDGDQLPTSTVQRKVLADLDRRRRLLANPSPTNKMLSVHPTANARRGSNGGSLSPRWSQSDDMEAAKNAQRSHDEYSESGGLDEDSLNPENALWKGGRVMANTVPPAPLSWHIPAIRKPSSHRLNDDTNGDFTHTAHTSDDEYGGDDDQDIDGHEGTYPRRHRSPASSSTGGDGDEAESALWNGPVRSAPSGAAPGDPGEKWWTNGTPSDPTDDASSALWKGPVVRRKESGSVVGSASYLAPADAEAMVWQGAVRQGGGSTVGTLRRDRAPSNPPTTGTASTTPEADVDPESVLWSGAVKGGGASEVMGLESVVWNGKVRSSKRSSVHGSVVGGGVDPALMGSVGSVSSVSLGRRSRKVSTASESLHPIDTSSVSSISVKLPQESDEIEPYVLVGGGADVSRASSVKSSRANRPTPPPPTGGFGDHAAVAPPPPSSSSHTSSRSGLHRAATVTGAPATSSWLRPFRNWVESIGETLASPPVSSPLASSTSPNSSAPPTTALPRRATTTAATSRPPPVIDDEEDEGPKLESSRERARREMRERDEEARRAAAAAAAGMVLGVASTSNVSLLDSDINEPIPTTLPIAPSITAAIPSTPPPITRRPSLPPPPAASRPPPPRVSPLTVSAPGGRRTSTGGTGMSPTDPGSALERMASAFENALETAIENPWSFVPAWMRQQQQAAAAAAAAEKEREGGVGVGGVGGLGGIVDEGELIVD